MTKRTNESIVSRDISRELLKELRAARKKAERPSKLGPNFYHMPQAPIMPMKGRYSRIRLQTKWSWRWRGCGYCGHDRHIEYTGGVSVTATVSMSYAGGFVGLGPNQTWRLKDGWKPADYDAMITKATTWGIKELRTIEYREQVEREVEGAGLDLEAAEAWAKENGLPIVYSEMSIDDCGKWLDYVKVAKEGK